MRLPSNTQRQYVPAMGYDVAMPSRTYIPWATFVLFTLASLVLSALPGTSDINVWYGWVKQLDLHGLRSGYNLGAGHIVHPPLGLLLLWLSHHAAMLVGLPVHTWPEVGFTGFGLATWLGLTVSTLLVVRLTGRAWWGVLFQGVFLLNAVVYGYFDVWGFPFLLLALHAMAQGRTGAGLAWALTASLVKWQFLILFPFFVLYALRPNLDSQGRTPARSFLPAAMILALTLIVFGPGTWLAFTRGLQSAVLSGQALNLGWLITWAMHLRWPESYGPLEDGLIGVIRTRDTRVLFVVRSLFALGYGLALWRLWRAPRNPDALYRYMLAGYLAFFLLNKGAHENHLAPAIVVAGYLAWRIPRWRWHALLVAIVLNINMLAFYDPLGQHRWDVRRMAGMDYSLPLAGLATIAVGIALYSLLRNDPPEGSSSQ